MSSPNLQRPRIPDPPVDASKDVKQWCVDLKKELDTFFTEQSLRGTDDQLTGQVTNVVVTDGFTIPPTSPKVGLVATTSVTSDTTVAIKGGRNGQTIEIYNRSAVTITLKHNAKIRCIGNVDLTLQPNDVALFHWDASFGYWVQVGGAGVSSQATITMIAQQAAQEVLGDIIISPVPVGTILAFGTQTLPDGYLECNGQDVSRFIYANLFGKIGVQFGSNDETTFKLPDMNGRAIRSASDSFPHGTYGGSDIVVDVAAGAIRIDVKGAFLALTFGIKT